MLTLGNSGFCNTTLDFQKGCECDTKVSCCCCFFFSNGIHLFLQINAQIPYEQINKKQLLFVGHYMSSKFVRLTSFSIYIFSINLIYTYTYTRHASGYKTVINDVQTLMESDACRHSASRPPLHDLEIFYPTSLRKDYTEAAFP